VVEDAEVDPPVRASLVWGLIAALVLGGVLGTVGPALGASVAASSPPPVVGNISGPAYVGTASTATYYINGTGGPAIAANGTQVGNLSWHARVTGGNTTGVSLSPNSSTFSGATPGKTQLKVSAVTQSLTITVEILSTYLGKNASTNLSYTVQVVVPYVVRATMVDESASTVGPFTVTVDLDGRAVGNVTVASISPSKVYNFTFDYATGGLAAGEHTFTISLAQEHGLVAFSGGATEYSQSFYVVGPPPDYALWILLGVIAFFGVLFIFATRVAARRRPTTRK
jgi:hypothetical protein